MNVEPSTEPTEERPENFRFPEEVNPSVEREPRPEKLFRAISINPEELTVERLREDLVPGTVNKDDPTKVLDGNELGVYMSTNPRMVESAYAKGGSGVSRLEVPQYASDRGLKKTVDLPGCGVIFEISTDGLDIRKPKISSVLQGVYNNGFQGDEWVADTVGQEHTKIKKLILSRYANDSETFTVAVDDTSDEELQKAIDAIRIEFDRRQSEAEGFKSFLGQLEETARMNEFKVRREWEKKKKAGTLFPKQTPSS